MNFRASRALLILSGVTAVFAVTPLAYLVVRVLDAGPARVIEVLFRQRTLETIFTSIALVSTVVTACLVIGVPISYALARIKLPWTGLWITVFSLPLAIPSYVAAYAWLAEFPAMSGFWAAALVLTMVSMPYIVIPTTISFRSSDPSLEEVALSLGSSRMRTFLSVALPQSWPATAAGALLVALYVLSDFGAVALFRVDAFTRVIYTSYRASFDRTTAAVLAVVLVVLAIALVFGERRVRGHFARWRIGSGAARSHQQVSLPKPALMAVAFGMGMVVVVSIGVPIYSLVRRLLEGSRLPLDMMELLTATFSSIWIAGLGTILAVLLALPVGILAARSSGRLVRILESVSYAGHALPAVVVGLSLVYFTLRVVPAIYQTAATLAIAYAILFLPKAIGATRASVAAVPPVLEQTARTLGRSSLNAWYSTTLRLSLGGIAAGGLLVWLTAMKELPATLMLRPTGFDTLATELWTRTEVSAYGSAAPYALTLIVLAAIPAWLLTWVSGRAAEVEYDRQGVSLESKSTVAL